MGFLIFGVINKFLNQRHVAKGIWKWDFCLAKTLW